VRLFLLSASPHLLGRMDHLQYPRGLLCKQRSALGLLRLCVGLTGHEMGQGNHRAPRFFEFLNSSSPNPSLFVLFMSSPPDLSLHVHYCGQKGIRIHSVHPRSLLGSLCNLPSGGSCDYPSNNLFSPQTQIND